MAARRTSLERWLAVAAAGAAARASWSSAAATARCAATRAQPRQRWPAARADAARPRADRRRRRRRRDPRVRAGRARSSRPTRSTGSARRRRARRTSCSRTCSCITSRASGSRACSPASRGARTRSFAASRAARASRLRQPTARPDRLQRRHAPRRGVSVHAGFAATRSRSAWPDAVARRGVLTKTGPARSGILFVARRDAGMTTRSTLVIGGAVRRLHGRDPARAAGWSVALVERRAFPRRKVCGECIAAPQPRAARSARRRRTSSRARRPAARRVGLLPATRRSYARLPRRSGAHVGPRARPRAPRHLLRRAREAGRGARYQPWASRHRRRAPAMACSMRRSRRSRAGESARRRRGRRRARLVGAAAVGARGAPRARAPGDLFAFKANFCAPPSSPACCRCSRSTAATAGWCSATAAALTIACCVRDDRLQAARADAARARGPARSRRCCGARAPACGARSPVRARGRHGSRAGRFGPGPRGMWSERGGFRVGNAAGEAHPIFGEGISMAMQSAFVLAALIGAAA